MANSRLRMAPNGLLDRTRTMRPISAGCCFMSLCDAIGKLHSGCVETSRYHGSITFRDRIAMAYRVAQGCAHARWWFVAGLACATKRAFFGHTGTADTTLLELAMQRQGIQTVHVVHGTNIGWPFAGLSDIAIYPTGADARFGASLPAYGRCTHIPFARPAVSPGDGRWALLTSYTHLQHPAYNSLGSALDREIVRLVRRAADELAIEPQKIYWRPHPQIALVKQEQRTALELTVNEAGFLNWPDDWDYDRIGSFSVVITTPSTVLTDALRMGQPAIVASHTSLQEDLVYNAHPLLVDTRQSLLAPAIRSILDSTSRASIFRAAWDAIEPGAPITLAGLNATVEQSSHQRARQHLFGDRQSG